MHFSKIFSLLSVVAIALAVPTAQDRPYGDDHPKGNNNRDWNNNQGNNTPNGNNNPPSQQGAICPQNVGSLQCCNSPQTEKLSNINPASLPNSLSSGGILDGILGGVLSGLAIPVALGCTVATCKEPVCCVNVEGTGGSDPEDGLISLLDNLLSGANLNLCGVEIL